ncbi:hypothetical protein CEK25_005946 [Fusarium fujikuroi]|nr:hypothetical protein CEK25_005946 [Fusarium fujikuroi]
MISHQRAVAAVAAADCGASASPKSSRAHSFPFSHFNLHKRRRLLGLRSLPFLESLRVNRWPRNNKLSVDSLQVADRLRYLVAHRLPSNSNFETAPFDSISATASNSTVGVAASVTLGVAPVVNPGSAPTRDLNSSSHPPRQHGSSHSSNAFPASTASKRERPASDDARAKSRRIHACARSIDSSMTRQLHPLQVTLPPTPTSASISPPTPIESGIASLLLTQIEFIIAIAAQENDVCIAIAARNCRVLELRADLTRAQEEITLHKRRRATPEKHFESIPLEA